MKQFIFLMLLFIIFGCDRSKDIDNENFLNKLKKAPSVNISKENLPEWLVVKINFLETAHSKDISWVKVRIFKGKWKNHTVYFISDSFSSCLFCDVYYEDGENIIWPADGMEFTGFCSTSKNWKLIYEFGEGVFLF